MRLSKLQRGDKGRRGRQTWVEVGNRNNSYSFNPTSPTLPTSIIPLAREENKREGIPLIFSFFSLFHVHDEVGGVGEVGRWRQTFLFSLPFEKRRGRFLPHGIGRKEVGAL